MKGDTGRYVEVLEALIRRSQAKKVDLERRLGWSRGALTKLLRGRQKLAVGHLLALLDVLDVDPLAFYTLVHGVEKRQGNEMLGEKVFALLGPAGTPLVLPRFLSDEDLDRRIRDAVEQALSKSGNE